MAALFPGKARAAGRACSRPARSPAPLPSQLRRSASSRRRSSFRQMGAVPRGARRGRPSRLARALRRRGRWGAAQQRALEHAEPATGRGPRGRGARSGPAKARRSRTAGLSVARTKRERWGAAVFSWSFRCRSWRALSGVTPPCRGSCCVVGPRYGRDAARVLRSFRGGASAHFGMDDRRPHPMLFEPI